MKRLLLLILFWLGIASFASAQAAPFRSEMLSLLPGDFAVCVVVNDLRGNWARWERSDWLKLFKQSSIGKSLLASPEMGQLARFQDEMKKHFDLDWPTLRDEILGDTLVLSYAPGADGKADDERGLVLLHLPKPERLVRVIDKLNEAQLKSGELSALTRHEFKGQAYHRRVQGNKSQFYFIKDSLAVIATKESVLHEVIARNTAKAMDDVWAKRFVQAGAESAVATICVNPRVLGPAGKKGDGLSHHWDALHAVFLTLAIRDEAELRLSIQADPVKLPAWAKPVFAKNNPPSELWQRFPEKSVLTIAAKTDFAATAEALKLLIPDKDRQKMAADWKAGIGALLPLDPVKEILPNLGPDWGVCVLPSKDAQEIPQAIFALAVKSGPRQVDQSIIKGIDFFAGLAVRKHNETHPDSPLRLQSTKLEKNEFKYLSGDAVFPAGLRPAWGLKHGYLVLATSPEALAELRFRNNKIGETTESPLVRLSTRELARLLEHRRNHIIAGLTDGQKMSPAAARKNLDDVIGAMNLLDRVTLSHQGTSDQATWILRLTPVSR